MSEALERLGVDPRSSTRRYVLARMKKLGVDVSYFEREGVRWTREILERAVAASASMNEVLRRALREVGVPEECAGCGVGSQWIGKPMTLEIDHISGEWRDNRRENLRLLCPNCHAITSTWCRGGRRRSPRAGGG
ncbi:HNH endonuclease [Streptomyces sp. NPDC002523]